MEKLSRAQLNRVQQVLIAERLGQELDRSSLYRLDGHRDVAISGDEDYRNVNVRRRELSLKIETTQARQPDIEHEASGSVRAPFVQEFGEPKPGRWLARSTDRIRPPSASRRWEGEPPIQ